MDVDHSRPLNGITVRKAITTRFPELRRLLPEPKMENPDACDPHIRLLAALQRRDIDTFFQILEQRDGITSKVSRQFSYFLSSFMVILFIPSLVPTFLVELSTNCIAIFLMILYII